MSCAGRRGEAGRQRLARSRRVCPSLPDRTPPRRRRLRYFPRGDAAAEAGQLSLFLDVVIPADAPEGWAHPVSVSLALYKKTVKNKLLECVFTADENSWGFSDFAPAEIALPGGEFNDDGTVMLCVLFMPCGDREYKPNVEDIARRLGEAMGV